jgi:hypothetical protein
MCYTPEALGFILLAPEDRLSPASFWTADSFYPPLMRQELVIVHGDGDIS